MTAQFVLRVIAGVLAVILLLIVAFTFISGGIDQWPQWDTFETRLQTTAQILAGVCALMIIVTKFQWHRLHSASGFGFVVCSMIAAGLAPVVWSGSAVSRGLLAGLAGLTIAAIILWMFRFGASSFAPMKNAEH